MKKLFALIATSLTLSVLPASAIVGGPWGNNNFTANGTGTYSATLFMQNGLGIARFTDDTNAQFSLLNQSVVFFKGIVYLGGCFGSVDHSGGRVDAITNGSSSNLFVNSGAGGGVGFCNTMWHADITTEAPILRFSGEGRANFFGALNQVTEVTVATVTNISDPSFTVTTTTTTETSTGGEDGVNNVGTLVQLWVMGGQISQQAVSALPTAGGGGAGGVAGQTVVPGL